MEELSPKLRKKLTPEQYAKWQATNKQYFDEVQILFEIRGIKNKKLAGVIAHNLAWLAVSEVV